MALPKSAWGTRRSATAPASLLHESLEFTSGGHGHIRIPGSAEVQKQLREGGPGTTVRDVALAIVRRLLDNADNDPGEVLFLGECLKAGASCTALPCGLIRGTSLEKGALANYLQEDDVQSWLLRTCAPSDGAHSPKSAVSRAASRTTSHGLSPEPRAAAEDADAGPRWPCALAKAGASEGLERLFGAEFQSWGIDVFEISRLTEGRELQFIGWEAFRQGDFLSEFGIMPGKARSFLQRVESSYASTEVVPYHNSRHAADVTQGVHVLLRGLGFSQFFEPLAAMALVLSALVHDMGHDGKNNLFHINVQDEFALTYNDRSVLENYHVSQAFKLLSKHPDANLLDVLDKERLAVIRKDIIDNVLTTDMSLHFRTVETLKNYVERLETDPQDWAEEAGSLSSLQGMLLHAADIGNMGKNAALADRWTALLKQEFHNQGDLERSLGLPISPLCDSRAKKFAGNQVGFIQFIVRPTFDVVASLSERVGATILKEVAANLKLWEDRKVKEDQEAELAAELAAESEARKNSPLSDQDVDRYDSAQSS